MTGPSDARTDVLDAIRRAVAGPQPNRLADYAAIRRDYIRAGDSSEDARLALFVDRLEHYNVSVQRAGLAALPAAIAQTCLSRGKRRLVTAATFPIAALPDHVELVPDRDLSYDELDRSDGVVTMSTLAVAMTGTIVLTHGAGEGRRALTLIPDYHLCVVRADQVVETVPEGIARLVALAPALVTTISGPSATADIEMIRVRGVHGPRTLDVIIVTG